MALDKLTIINNGGLSTTSDYRVGVLTATKFVGPIEGAITSADATFTGNVSIGGTLTYEDVTNIDSVGIITARDGIDCNGDIDVDGHTNLDNVSVAGVSTFSKKIILPDSTDTSNGRLVFGATTDMMLFHYGGANYIDLTSNLNIRGSTSGNIIKIKAKQSEESIIVNPDGAVQLFYDNSQKLGTAGWGVQINGILKVLDATDSSGATNHLALGASNDLKLFHDGSHNRIHSSTGFLDINNSADLISITASNRIDISDDFIRLRSRDGSDVYMTGTVNSSVDLYFNNNKRFTTSNYGVDLFGQSTAAQLRLKTQEGTNRGMIWVNNSNHLYISDAQDHTILKGIKDGGVELYFDNSKKFETNSSGIEVIGNIFIADGSTNTNKVTIGTGEDLNLYHAGTDSYIENKTGDLYISTTFSGDDIILYSIDDVQIKVQSGEDAIKCIGNGAVELYHDNSKKFETTSTGATVTGALTTNNGGGNAVLGSHLDLGDNQKVRCGASDDLQIYHDGTHSNIDNATNELRIESFNLMRFNTNDFRVYKGNLTELTFRAVGDGSNYLYHNGSLKFETTSTGVTVTGQIISDGLQMGDDERIKLGTGDDLEIYHNGINAQFDNSTGNLEIRNKGTFSGTRNIFIRAKVDESSITCKSDGAVELYFDNSKKLETTTNGVTITGDLYVTDDITIADDLFMGDSDVIRMGDSEDLKISHTGSESRIDFSATAHNLIIMGPGGSNFIDLQPRNGHKSVRAIANNAVELYFDNSKKFETNNTGAFVTGELGCDTLYMGDNEKAKFGNNDDLQIWHDGTSSLIKSTGHPIAHYSNTRHHFLNADGSENVAVLVPNAQCEFYYDGLKKFETTSSGVNVTDSDGSVNIKLINNSGTAGFVYSDGTNTGFLDSQAHFLVKGIKDGAAELYHNNSKKFETTSGGVTVTGDVDSTTGIFERTNNGTSQIQFSTTNETKLKHLSNGQVKFSLVGYNNVYGGALDAQTSSNYIRILTASDEQAVVCRTDGAVELYHDNSKKFETHSGGVSVLGNLSLTNADNYQLRLGAGSDLKLYHDGNNSIIGNSTGALIIATPSELLLRSNTGQNMIRGVPGGESALYHANAKKLNTLSGGVQIYGNLAMDNNAKIQTGSSAHMVSIQGGATNMGGRIELRGGNGDGDIRFFAQGGTSTQQERMRISKTGAISSAVTRQAVSYTAFATPTYYTHSGTARSDVTIDVSSVFGVPDNAKAILVQGWYHISGYTGNNNQGDHASSHFSEYSNWATANPWSFYHSTSTNWGQYVMDHDGDSSGINLHHYGVWGGQGIVNVNPNGNIYGRLYWGYSGGTHYNQLWCFGYYI